MSDDVEIEVLDLGLQSSVRGDQVSFWSNVIPVHGGGANLEDAQDDFIDALVDYADLWSKELYLAANHRQNADLVQRVLLQVGDIEELRRMVFGESKVISGLSSWLDDLASIDA